MKHLHLAIPRIEPMTIAAVRPVNGKLTQAKSVWDRFVLTGEKRYLRELISSVDCCIKQANLWESRGAHVLAAKYMLRAVKLIDAIIDVDPRPNYFHEKKFLIRQAIRLFSRSEKDYGPDPEVHLFKSDCYILLANGTGSAMEKKMAEIQERNMGVLAELTALVVSGRLKQAIVENLYEGNFDVALECTVQLADYAPLAARFFSSGTSTSPEDWLTHSINSWLANELGKHVLCPELRQKFDAPMNVIESAIEIGRYRATPPATV